MLDSSSTSSTISPKPPCRPLIGRCAITPSCSLLVRPKRERVTSRGCGISAFQIRPFSMRSKLRHISTISIEWRMVWASTRKIS